MSSDRSISRTVQVLLHFGVSIMKPETVYTVDSGKLQVFASPLSIVTFLTYFGIPTRITLGMRTIHVLGTQLVGG